jgi:hypothetical protein
MPTTQKQKDDRDRELYNLLPGERERMRKYQKGRDPITGQPLKPAAHCDHNHQTGAIRGLLNPLTNKRLIEDADLLTAMLKYLEDPPAPKALGEKVYGLLGRAKRKKVMKYGPLGTREPLPRKSLAV